MSQIQNAGLGEFKLRDLNDEINKLLREKGHWEDRVCVDVMAVVSQAEPKPCATLLTLEGGIGFLYLLDCDKISEMREDFPLFYKWFWLIASCALSG